MFAVDTDDLIESFVKQKIRTLFAQQGELTFRKFEQKTGLWLENQVQGTIISTGGGFFMVENLNRIGKVVYLHSSLEGILATIMQSPIAAKKIKKRPLLQDMDKAKLLYNTRLPLYRQKADFEVNVEARKTSDCCRRYRLFAAQRWCSLKTKYCRLLISSLLFPEPLGRLMQNLP